MIELLLVKAFQCKANLLDDILEGEKGHSRLNNLGSSSNITAPARDDAIPTELHLEADAVFLATTPVEDRPDAAENSRLWLSRVNETLLKAGIPMA